MFANKLFINVLAITSLLEAITKGKMGFAEVKNWSGGGGGEFLKFDMVMGKQILF